MKRSQAGRALVNTPKVACACSSPQPALPQTSSTDAADAAPQHPVIKALMPLDVELANGSPPIGSMLALASPSVSESTTACPPSPYSTTAASFDSSRRATGEAHSGAGDGGVAIKVALIVRQVSPAAGAQLCACMRRHAFMLPRRKAPTWRSAGDTHTARSRPCATAY